MIIPPPIAAIFDLFPRKARFAKEKESPEFIAGKKAGFEEGQQNAYRQLIEKSTEISLEEYKDLTQYLVSRNLILSYDLMKGGFSVRKIMQEFIDQLPGPVIRPKRVTMKLKRQQYIPNKGWGFTLRGEKKTAQCDLVSFFSMSLKEAVESIDINEIESIKIDN